MYLCRPPLRRTSPVIYYTLQDSIGVTGRTRTHTQIAMNSRGKRPRLLVLGTGMRHSVASQCDEHIIASSPPPLTHVGRMGNGLTRQGSQYEHHWAFGGATTPSLHSLASSLVKRAIVSRGDAQSGAIFADLTPILALSLLRETSSHLSAPQLSQIEATLVGRRGRDDPQDRQREQPSSSYSFDQPPTLNMGDSAITPGSSGSTNDDYWVSGHGPTGPARGDGEDFLDPADDTLKWALQHAISQGWEEQVRRLQGQTRGCPERGPREDVRSYYGRLAEHQRRRLADIGERLRDAYGREGATVRTSKLIGPISHPIGGTRQRISSLPFQGASTSSALMRKSRQEAILSGRGGGNIVSVTRAVGSTGPGTSSGSGSRARPVTRPGPRTDGAPSTPMGILLPPRRK